MPVLETIRRALVETNKRLVREGIEEPKINLAISDDQWREFVCEAADTGAPLPEPGADFVELCGHIVSRRSAGHPYFGEIDF